MVLDQLKMVEEDSILKDFEKVSVSNMYDQYYHGHGKLLLTGEYFILEGAKGLALPTTVGQSMGVRYSQSFNPKLTWKSFDLNGNLWLEGHFEFWHFNILDENPSPEVIFLQRLLRESRFQNKHFLRDGQDVLIETTLGFPLEWGLGSSSTLVYNMAQWAYISAFELQFKTLGGSGYDIACAQSDGPIVYEVLSNEPNWEPVGFYPSYHEDLFFIYLGQKKNSRDAISDIKKKRPFSQNIIRDISQLTKSLLEVPDIVSFEKIMNEHERIISTELGMKTIKQLKFQDYPGTIKSLGAWGGDFILVTSKEGIAPVKDFFNTRGLDVIIPFKDLIMKKPSIYPNQERHSSIH